MNVLVTGGAGYIGSHTCFHLHQQGFHPIVVDSLERGHKSFVRWGDFYQLNLLDKVALKKVFQEHKIDCVIHFAAYAYVQESNEKPQLYLENNVKSVLNLLDVMQEFNVERLVFSSTCSVYGNKNHSQPLAETECVAPMNVYAYSKYLAEQAIIAAPQIKSVILRYFNAAGGIPREQLGEDHDPETRLIPLAIKAAEDPNFVLKVFGKDYPTNDGTAIRDYIHVSDLASAHIKAMDYLSQNKPSTIFNLGTEKGNSVLDVIKTVEKTYGKVCKKEIHSRREGDPSVLVADAAKAKNELGWIPSYSFTQTVKDAYDWYLVKNKISL